MSWTNELYRVYDLAVEAGIDMLPISHSTANAQIEITVSEEGEFIEAAAVEKENAVTVRTEDAEYAADCVFVLRPSVAPATLLPGLETEGAAVRHDEKMRTSVPRVCVAGDAAGGPKQVAKAVGEGCVAALSLAEDLR